MIPVKYINENRDTHEIKTSTYILMIVMTIILVLALASKDTIVCHAEQPYNAPPRLFKNCMESYIGNEYSEARRPSCERLWGMWTREYLLEESEYFSSL